MGKFFVEFNANSVYWFNAGVTVVFSQNKIDAMLESKDFRKGIHMLEWERRRLEMEIHDLTVKAQDIQMLKLTRELQSVLASTAGLSTAGELARIDKTLQSQNLNHQKESSLIFFNFTSLILDREPKID